MSVMRVRAPEVSSAARPPQRVRDQAREALALMAFSAAASLGFALLLLASAALGR